MTQINFTLRLVTGGVDRSVVLWEVTSRKRKTTRTLEVGGEVTSLAFSPDGK
jgi:WD40 repeat protein